jgi:glycerol-3-phosphate dehydrogenase (NAD(P)+)
MTKAADGRKATRSGTLAVLGAGAWGTALANMAALSHAKVWLWAHDPAHVEAMRATRRNERRLPGVALAAEVEPVADIACVGAADHVLAVVPAQSFRETAEAMRGHLRPGAAVVNCAKGIEQRTGLYMREILAEVLPGQPAAALSGPSFAADLARGLPTAVTLAAEKIELAEELCARLAAPHFRLYRSSDLVGVEIGGAAKNVLAIACGVTLGRELGASAHAALLARGFAELMRFATAQGARPETIMGLSGLGDLALTCSSPQSRNFALGFAIGRGEKPQNAGHGKLTEGALTARILTEKARRLGVEMPIAEAVAAILENRIEVGAAIEALMSRPFKAEG